MAFGQLYALYARAVHGVVLARVPWIEVEDLVQDVFVTAMERLASLRDAEAFGAWLMRIARNRATDHLRRRFRFVSGGESDDSATPGRPQAVASPDRTEALAVLSVIRSLPETYRETLTLRLVEGLTGPEIAERTGLTPGSVRVNLHRGMKQLRDRLEGAR
jgi:RNA polymerase sigma-70 factor (ECF subfamily)